MNICIISPNLNPEINVSGISTVVNSIINHNLQHNYFHFELGKRDKKNKYDFDSFKLVFKFFFFHFFIRQNQINLIHQNVPFNLKGIIREFILNKIGKFSKIKTIIHIHGGEYVIRKPTNPILNYCIHSLLNNNEIVIVLSDLEKNSISKNYGFNNSIVLPNSISIKDENFSKIFSKVPIFIFLGRIHQSKGIYEIIEMLNKIKLVFKFKFHLYGDGPLLQFTIEQLNSILGADFFYGGVISGQNKFDALSNADYFLLPSRYGEGLPMALLESMSLGLIPIVTNDGSMNTLIKDKFNGIKVKKNDPYDFLQKTINILNDKTLQLKISQNAFNTVLKYHNIDNYIISLNKIYNL
jgi:glycosyltransferase involved in cell wall biosynthesis